MERAIRSSLFFLVLAVGGSGCGHSREGACVELRVSLCRKRLECGYESGGSDYIRACEQAAKRECTEVACLDPAKPNYDPVAADACPISISALTCTEYDQLGNGFPAPCNDICHP